MEICKKCIQPDSRPGIFFNNGICGACIWEEEKKEIDWETRKSQLNDIVIKIKKLKKANYDCVIGVSGGKDSTKQAITARDILGLRCLLVNSEPENITDIGKHNIENLKHLGFDVISIRPNPKIIKKLIKRDFYKNLNPIKITEYSLWASTYIIAEKFNIPLIIQGENPGLTLGTSLTGVGKDSNALKANELQTISTKWEEYLDVEGIREGDLFLYHYDRKILEENKIQGIWLQYYLKEWSQRENAEFSKKFGFKHRENFEPSSIGTYFPYAQLDSDLVPVNQMLKFIKFGFGQCMDHACYDLREQRISRKEAIELVKKYDGKCSIEYIEGFCKYIDINLEEFWKVANSFRGPMWEKTDSSEWKNKYWEKLEEKI
jgi:N-acetyl sugar amidotransferase